MECRGKSYLSSLDTCNEDKALGTQVFATRRHFSANRKYKNIIVFKALAGKKGGAQGLGD